MVLNKIVQYCTRIENNLNRFDNDYSAFLNDYMFQDACCMCIVQIGELVGQLSDETKALNSSVPWRVIKDTRNFYVHNYGAIDAEAVWETMTSDIPALKAACLQLLN